MIPTNINAQFLLDDEINSDFYQLRVKNIEEFINRFNYNRDERGNIIVYHDSLKNNRYKKIIFLFSNDILNKYFQKDDTEKYTSKTDTNIAIDFINKIVYDSLPLFLDMYESKWYAEAICDVTYKGKPNNIKLYLSFNYNKTTKETKWVIDSCVARCLNITVRGKTKLSPVSHNLNFLGISKTNLLYPEQMINFAYDNYKPDYLAILFYLINQRLLKINYVKNLTFCFCNIAGYTFFVKNYRIESSHSGWLISNIYKSN